MRAPVMRICATRTGFGARRVVPSGYGDDSRPCPIPKIAVLIAPDRRSPSRRDLWLRFRHSRLAGVADRLRVRSFHRLSALWAPARSSNARLEDDATTGSAIAVGMPLGQFRLRVDGRRDRNWFQRKISPLFSAFQEFLEGQDWYLLGKLMFGRYDWPCSRVVKLNFSRSSFHFASLIALNSAGCSSTYRSTSAAR